MAKMNRATRKAKLLKRIGKLQTRIANAKDQNKKRETKIKLYQGRIKRIAA